MAGQKRRLTEREASELWARAAELQESARREAEVVVHTDEGETGSITADVARLAAVESGIDGRFVDSASLQLAAEPHLDATTGSERAASALGFPERSLTERVTVRGSLSSVVAAVNEVTASESFQSDPVELPVEEDDRVALIYEVPQNLKAVFSEGSFHYRVRYSAEVERYAMLISRVDDDQCEVTVHCALGRSFRQNAIAMRVLQFIAAGGVATGIGFAVSALAGVVGLAGVAATATVGVGAALAALGGFRGVGALYRWGYRKRHERLRGAFRKLLTAVRMRTER